MGKGIYLNLIITLGLLLLVVILIQPPKLGPGVLDAESNFYPALHNSLYYLDQARAIQQKL
jgi:hypothetical protein